MNINTKGLAHLLLVIVIVIIGIGGILFLSWQKGLIKTTDKDVSLTTILDETANWKTYTSSKMNSSMQYPSLFTLLADPRESVYREDFDQSWDRLYFFQDESDAQNYLDCLRLGKKQFDDIDANPDKPFDTSELVDWEGACDLKNLVIEIIIKKDPTPLDRKDEVYEEYRSSNGRIWFRNKHGVLLGGAYSSIILEAETKSANNLSLIQVVIVAHTNDQMKKLESITNLSMHEFFDQILSTFKFLE